MKWGVFGQGGNKKAGQCVFFSGSFLFFGGEFFGQIIFNPNFFGNGGSSVFCLTLLPLRFACSVVGEK